MKNPENRFTIAQIKTHPWITKNGSDPMPDLVYENIEATDVDKQNAVSSLNNVGRALLRKL